MANETKTVNIDPQSSKQALLDIIAAKDRNLLWGWIKQFIGYEIPREKICPDHCAPFDFVADYLFGEVDFAVVLANRSGGKTQNFGILDTILAFLYDDIEIATVGAIQFQAQKCYEYFKSFSLQFPFSHNTGTQTMKKSTGKNKSSVQVLTGTMSGVNAPHPQLLFVDEIDLMAWPVLQQALSMPQSKHGVLAKTVLTSTRKFAGGAMQRLMDEAPTKGYKVYQWCVWEIMEKLPTDPVALDRVQKVFGNELPANINKADGYYTWHDALQKRNSPLEAETWEVEWLCRKPGLEGVIYGSSYSDDNNFLMDWSPAGRPGYIYLLEDFGNVENHPDVLLPAWIPPEFDRMVIFDELYMTGYGTDDIWLAVNEMLNGYGHRLPDPAQGDAGTITGWIGDYHGITEIKDRENKGAPMMAKNEDAGMYLVQNGIVIVKKFLRSGRLMITDKCVNLRTEFLSYKRKKNADGTYSPIPVKMFDHGPDAVRYGLIILGALLSERAFAIIKEEKQPAREDRTTIVKQPKSYEKRPITAGMLSERY